MPDPESGRGLPAVGPDPEGMPAFAAMPTARLREELSRTLEMTAANLLRLARIVRALEERGEDLSDLRLGLLSYLRQIAYGSVLPEVVVRFAESPALVKAVGSLPAPDQRRLAAGEPVTLVVPRGDHGHDLRRADPLRMTAAQVRQAFAPGRLRDEAEQVLLLESARGQKARDGRRPGAVVGPGGITVDRRNRGLRVGGVFVPVATVVEALGLLAEDEARHGPDRGVDDDDPYASPMMVHLSVAQHQAIKEAALRGKTSVAALVRRALSAYGLLG